MRAQRPRLAPGRVALLVGLGVLFQSACASPEPHDTVSPSFWRLRSPDGNGTAYLLGSIHVGPEDGWTFPAVVWTAFSESTTLVVEFDPLSPANARAQRLMIEKGRLPRGQSLLDLVSAETWSQTRQRLAAADISEADALRLKPWVLALSLTGAAIERLGFQPERGVDVEFLQRSGDRQIVQLESAESQIALFDDMDPAMQELMLIDTLITTEEMSDFLLQLMDSWRSGDDEAMSSLYLSGLSERPELAPFYDVIIDQRNASMSEQLEAIIRAGGTHFVVVGALHVIGESGIVASLVRSGFEAERINTY